MVSKTSTAPATENPQWFLHEIPNATRRSWYTVIWTQRLLDWGKWSWNGGLQSIRQAHGSQRKGKATSWSAEWWRWECAEISWADATTEGTGRASRRSNSEGSTSTATTRCSPMSTREPRMSPTANKALYLQDISISTCMFVYYRSTEVKILALCNTVPCSILSGKLGRDPEQKHPLRTGAGERELRRGLQSPSLSDTLPFRSRTAKSRLLYGKTPTI